MKSPLVSILIPTYNQADYILRAINSALRQDYPNIEVIVSDDRSPDHTQAVVERFVSERGDPRLRYSRNQEKLGILRHYHCGLHEKARGDWFVNLDGDDFFLDDGFISAAMKLAADNPDMNLIFADYAEYFEHSGERIDIINRNLPEKMSDSEFFEGYASGKITWNHNSIIYRRSPAVSLGFYWDPVVPRNDWESFLRLIVGSPVGYLPRVVAAWVQHGSNETRRLDVEKYMNNFALIDGTADFAKANGMPAAIVDRWHRKLRYTTTKLACVGYLRQNDLAGLAKFLRRVAHIHPLLPFQAVSDPKLVARAILARSPSIYNTAKRIARRLRT